jgi:hypothetical protein
MWISSTRGKDQDGEAVRDAFLAIKRGMVTFSRDPLHSQNNLPRNEVHVPVQY